MAWNDGGRMNEGAHMGAQVSNPDGLTWRCKTEVRKRWVGDDTRHRAGHEEFLSIDGNLAMNGGVANIWSRLVTKAPSTSSTGAQLQAFSTGNARIGVGASTATAAATQTDLQSTAKKYNGMASGYPLTWNVTSSSGRMAKFQSLFTSSQANFAWNEWGIFNSTAATRRMLNRKVQSLGTKSSAAQWTLTVTLSVS